MQIAKMKEAKKSEAVNFSCNALRQLISSKFLGQNRILFI